MEKLTEYVDGKYIRIKGTKSLYPKNERDGAPLSNAIARLAAYEETGLEPEELAQAEKEGRLVVLPCKDWFEIVFGEQELFWGIDTDYIETPIREISVDNAERFTWYDGWKTLVLRGNDENGLDWEFSPEDIGKTVFLTREAAEAALKERECTK